MKEVKIRLSSVQDAKDFVDLAGKCDFDIDLYCGHVIIDGKSLIGVLSMDLKRALTVKFDGENDKFDEFLKSHSILSETAA